MMNPVLRRMWELGTPAVLFSCPRDEGAFLGTVRPRTLPPGRAQFINAGGAAATDVRIAVGASVPGADRRRGRISRS